MPNIKQNLALFLTNHLFLGTRERFFPVKRTLLNWGGFEIGEGSRIVGPVFITGGLIVGKDTWIGRDLSIDGNGTVIIGSRCDIAPSVRFYTGGHEIGDASHRAGEGFNKDIVIGDGCWLCAASSYLSGIQVGKGIIVAAGAVVTHSFDSNLMIGGVPARTIRVLDDADDAKDGRVE